MLTPKTAICVLARQLLAWRVLLCQLLATLADFLVLISILHQAGR